MAATTLRLYFQTLIQVISTLIAGSLCRVMLTMATRIHDQCFLQTCHILHHVPYLSQILSFL